MELKVLKINFKWEIVKIVGDYTYKYEITKQLDTKLGRWKWLCYKEIRIL